MGRTKRVRKPKSGFARLNSSSATKDNRREARPASLQLEELEAELNQRKVDLIKVDLDVAGTFAAIAQNASDDSLKRSRNRRHARQGYDAVVHFMRTALIDEKQRREMQIKLTELKAALAALGEVFAQ